MAIRFEKAFGIKADTLMRMQTAYDMAQVRAHSDDLIRLGCSKTPAFDALILLSKTANEWIDVRRTSRRCGARLCDFNQESGEVDLLRCAFSFGA